MAFIDVRDVTKIFGERVDESLARLRDGHSADAIREATGDIVAVREASFSVEKGETFVVMGLSGSGKSTLLRCINRLVQPTDGQVLLNGEDVTGASDERLMELRRHTMSMVFQHFGLLPHRSVLGNVEYGLEVSGMKAEERQTKARQALDLVGLSDAGDRAPNELSGGMQQRVGLARALANDPEVLLMDEAFSALDPLIRADMQDELLALQAEMHRTIVFITHDLDEALKVGDRIAIMRDGAVVQVGTPEAILTRPADDYVEAFVQNVDRTRVLTAAALVRAASGSSGASASNGVPDDADHVQADTRLVDLLPRMMASNGPLIVIDGDDVLGVLNRNDVLHHLRAPDRSESPPLPASS